MSLKNVEILGYIVVRVFKENVLIEEILQSRLAAHSDIIDDFIPQKDGFETAERKFVEIDELPLYIDWLSFDSGKEILSKLKSYTDSVKK